MAFPHLQGLSEGGNMQDIPETVQWLLDFANLGKKPAVLNPPIESVPKLKRIPKTPPELFEPRGLVFDDYHPSMKRTYNGWQWLIARNKEPLFCGKDFWEFYPELDEFKQFFLDKGLPPEGKIQVIKFEPIKKLTILSWELLLKKTGKVSVVTDSGTKIIDSSVFESKSHSSLVMDSWRPAILALKRIIEKSQKSTGVIKAICKLYSGVTSRDCILIEGESFPHNGALPQAVYAYILDFWTNSKELHPLLTQCRFCGRFWIKNDKRKYFCGDSCEIKFNAVSYKDNNKRVRKLRADNKEFQQKEDYNKMITWLKSKGDTQDNAETEAHKWIIEDKKSLKEYKRTKGRMYGFL